MRYPRWFPYPRCFVRMIIGINSIAMSGIVVGIFVLMFGGMAGLITVITRGLGVVMVIPLVGVAIAGPIWLHAHVRQLVAAICNLFRQEPLSWSWNPPKQFWHESWVDWVTTIGSCLFVILGYKLLRGLVLDDFAGNIPLRDAEDDFLLWVWVFLMLYIHQVRYLVLQYWEEKRKRKNKRANRSQLPRAKRPVKAIDDSDQELNQLRWQQRQRVSPPPLPKDSIDEELEWLKREMEDKD
ncbi:MULTISPECIES: APC family permease [Spirulina sp. CCY15215]|uniref:APC family permease n=1 Tax=Spirulina sp. CCY15215 TaxID=2767591 RepID=UPI0019522995|nr:APC family permease [Spirulina major]